MDDLQLVEVIWLDAGLETAQMELEHAKEIKPMLRKNVGYQLLYDKENIIICFGIVTDKGLCVTDQTLIIPRPMVTEIRQL